MRIYIYTPLFGALSSTLSLRKCHEVPIQRTYIEWGALNRLFVFYKKTNLFQQHACNIVPKSNFRISWRNFMELGMSCHICNGSTGSFYVMTFPCILMTRQHTYLFFSVFTSRPTSLISSVRARNIVTNTYYNYVHYVVYSFLLLLPLS